MRTLLVLGLGLVLVAPAAARTHLPKPKRGFQMRVGSYVIKPGEDLEVCEYRRLPNTKPMDVSGFELRMPAGAHHFAMWTYGGSIHDDARFPKGPVASVGCTGVSPDEGIPQLLIPTQSPNTELRLPEGIALRLEPHQQVWLNPHMRNATLDPFTPDIRFNFYRAKKSAIRHYAEGMAIGTPSIHIPAGGDQTVTAEWAAPVDLTVIHLSTHQHRLGTYANIEVVSSDGVTRDKVVETFDWKHPSSVWPKDGIRLVKGQKLRLTCSWHNTDDHEVRFGTKTTDEMCFIIGFYYRDPGDTAPVLGSGCIPSRTGLLCPLVPAVSAER